MSGADFQNKMLIIILKFNILAIGKVRRALIFDKMGNIMIAESNHTIKN